MIDKVYCISLKNANERRKRTKKEIKTLFPLSELIFHNAVKNEKNPSRGCGESFCECIQKYGIEQNQDYIIIIEDDIKFVKNAYEKIEQAIKNLPNEYDILLGGSYNLKHSSLFKPYNAHWMKVGDYASHHFVIIRKSAYKLIMKYLSQNKFQNIDRFIGQTYSEKGILNIYLMWPMPIQQYDGYSYIQKRHTLYNTVEWAMNHRLIWYNANIHRTNEIIFPEKITNTNTNFLQFDKQITEYIDFLKLEYTHFTFNSVLLTDARYWNSMKSLYNKICKTKYKISLPEYILYKKNMQTFFAIFDPKIKINDSMIWMRHKNPNEWNVYIKKKYNMVYEDFLCANESNLNLLFE